MARTFTYTTSAFLLGAAFFLFTSNLIQITLQPDAVGTAVLLGYGLVYGNMTYLLTRRYMRREHVFENFSFAIGFIILFPAVLLIEVQGQIFPTLASKLFYYAILLAGIMVGSWRGRRKGRLMREELIEKKKREQESNGQQEGNSEPEK